jgi:hypothetical protein
MRWILFLPVTLISQRVFIFVLKFPIGFLLPNRLGLVIIYALAGAASTFIAERMAPNRKVMAGFIAFGANFIFALPVVIYTFTTFDMEQLLADGAQQLSAALQMLGLVAGSLIAAIMIWKRTPKETNDPASELSEQEHS